MNRKAGCSRTRVPSCPRPAGGGQLACRPWPSSCRNSAARRWRTPTGSRPSPTTSPALSVPGDNVVVVVSAMGKTTDDLLSLADQVSKVIPGREMDMLLDRRVSGSRWRCVCMALAERGDRGCLFHGQPSRHHHRHIHTKARIIEVKGDRIPCRPGGGSVPVVAGFQGVSSTRDITTLGRGGSDTTAVALAAALGADRCEIYTDVSGVFSADPRIVPTARKLPKISFEEMLEIAATGGRVLASAVGRVRPQPSRHSARPLELHLGTGHARHRGGPKHGAASRVGRHQRHVVRRRSRCREWRTGRESQGLCSATWPTAR